MIGPEPIISTEVMELSFGIMYCLLQACKSKGLSGKNEMRKIIN